MEFASIVVLYNRFAGESSLLAQLKGNKNVLVYDNSTREMGNKAFCRKAGWQYLANGQNVGLSRAYNACLDALAKQGFSGFVCLFDDDAAIDARYFTALRSAISAHPEGDIFLPILTAGGRIVSPCLITKSYRAAFYTSKEECLRAAGPQVHAFNSGMAIRFSLFQQYRYDERLFLDGVDYKFMLDMHQKGAHVQVMDYTCGHGFSGTQKPQKEAALTRFLLYAKDMRTALSASPAVWRRVMTKRALHLCFTYKSPVFLSILLQKEVK